MTSIKFHMEFHKPVRMLTTFLCAGTFDL